MSTVARDIVLVYNRYLVELLVILKTHGGTCAARALTAARHRAVDASSDAYIRHAIQRDVAGIVMRSPAEDVLDAKRELMSSDVLLAGLPLAGLLADPPLSGGEAGHARALIHILATLAAAHSPDEPALEKQTLAVIARLQKPSTADADPGALLDAVLEDDVRGLLELCRSHLCPPQTTPDDIEKMLESSKLGAFAREMLDDIGPDTLVGLTKDPTKAFDLAQITDENSPIGSIVKKAGSKLVAKLSNGELNKDELITDLVKMMGAFGGASSMPNGMSDVMTTMTGMLQGLQASTAAPAKPRQQPQKQNHCKPRR